MLVVAIPTPCSAPGVIDARAMAHWSSQLVDRGVNGLFVLGSTGEMVLVDEDDRRRLVAATVEQVGARAEVQVGVGGFGARQTARLAKLAAKDGAHRAIIMAPFFQLLSQRELQDFARRVADDSPIPVGIYHHLRMQTQFSVETIAELAGHPNISLVKDTSNDIARLARLVEATQQNNVFILQGCENLIADSLHAGAQGCVSALASVAPEWHRFLLDAFRDRQPERAAGWQEQLNRLVAVFRLPDVSRSLASFVHTLKRGAQLRGWLDSTGCVVAGFEATRQFNEQIEEVFRASGLLSNMSLPAEPAVRSA